MPLTDERTISWVKAARKDFETFPQSVQTEGARPLVVAARGAKADNAKPMKGLGRGVMEIVIRYRGEAFRVIYALHIGADIWVVHAFQKKSHRGIETPKHEIDLVKDRLKRLKEM